MKTNSLYPRDELRLLCTLPHMTPEQERRADEILRERIAEVRASWKTGTYVDEEMEDDEL